MSTNNVKSVDGSEAISAIKERLNSLGSREISVVDTEKLPETFTVKSVENKAFINLVKGLECFAQKDVAVISVTDSIQKKPKVNKPK